MKTRICLGINIFILLTIVFNSYLAYTQDYVIEYNQITSLLTGLTESVYQLEIKKDKSIYFRLKRNFTNKEGNDVIKLNKNIVPFVYNNFTSKKAIYNQPVFNKIMFVEDPLPMQVWSLQSETKKINNINCKKATTSFRGRNYTAWYTEDIPIIGGPWKFNGLPGLILAVSSEDGALSIEANKIEKKNNLTLTKFNINKKKLISWEEYCKKFNSAVGLITKRFKLDPDPDVEYDLKFELLEKIEQ